MHTSRKLFTVFVFALFASLFISNVQAQTKARTIDFTQQLLDLDGKPIQNNTDGKSTEPLTLGFVAEQALNTVRQEEAQMTGQQKADIYALMLKIHRKAHVALTVEELSLLKDRVSKAGYFPIVVGQALRLLDPVMGESAAASESEQKK